MAISPAVTRTACGACMAVRTTRSRLRASAPRQGNSIEAAAPVLSKAVTAGLGGAFKPAHIVFVVDLPRTRNMKVMRRVVRAAWVGEDAGDLSTLVNPEAVEAIREARA